jgi:hypothetical protein
MDCLLIIKANVRMDINLAKNFLSMHLVEVSHFVPQSVLKEVEWLEDLKLVKCIDYRAKPIKRCTYRLIIF